MEGSAVFQENNVPFHTAEGIQIGANNTEGK